MAESIAREYTKRIVLWQPNTGFVCDFSPLTILETNLAEQSVDVYQAADGTSLPEKQQHVGQIRNIRMETMEHLKVMQRVGCPVRMVALAHAKHTLWYEPTRIQNISERGGFGRFAPDRVQLINHVFDAGIHQGRDLLAGVPWECTEANELSEFAGTGLDPIIPSSGSGGSGGGSGSGSGDGTFNPWVLSHGSMPGYVAPYWQCGESDSVDGTGLYTGDGVVLEMELPIGGARLRLVASSGTIEFVGWTGNTLLTATIGQTVTVPLFTMFIRVTVPTASYRPRLDVVDSGRAVSLRDGICLPCDQRSVEAPPWVFEEVLPAYWICPEGVSCIVLGTNTCPYLCHSEAGNAPAAVWTGGSGLVVGVLEEGDTPRSATLTVSGGNDGFGRFAFGACDPDCDDFDIARIEAFTEQGVPITTPGFTSSVYERSNETVVVGSGSGGTTCRVERTWRVEYAYAISPSTFYYEIDLSDGKDTCTITITINKPGAGS